MKSSTSREIYDSILHQLEKVRHSGDDKATARCPAHEDKTPSLSITRKSDRVLLHCFSGCELEAVVAAIDWTLPDLFISDESWHAYEARAITDERANEDRESYALPPDVPGQIALWVEALRGCDDPPASLRVLRLIAGSDVWRDLAVELRVAVVDAIPRTSARRMALVVLGRLDDRRLVWVDPPIVSGADAEDNGVVTLADLLKHDIPTAPAVARGLAFGGTMGFVRGPKGCGKTTILAAAAARVSQGESWAAAPTIEGTVLVICDDDPRTWSLALRDYGAHPDRVLIAPARMASRRGMLAELLAEHRPVWVIIDNLRTWCRAMQLDTDNSSAAANAIDPLGEVVRTCEYPVALTLIHNEARGKDGSDYAGRMRNSTVFEDAADWIIGVSHERESTSTVITQGEKTRRGIQTETLTVDLSPTGHGTPARAGGGGTHPLDRQILSFLEGREGVSARAVRKAVSGRASAIDDRLKAVAAHGDDGLWRVRPDSGIGGVGIRDAVRPESASDPTSHCPDAPGRTASLSASQPIRDAPLGRTSGRTHSASQTDALALVESAPAGGADDGGVLGWGCDDGGDGGGPCSSHFCYGGEPDASGKRGRGTAVRGCRGLCVPCYYQTTVQRRWAIGEKPTDGVPRCTICGRWDGKVLDRRELGFIYTVDIPDGAVNCVRCQSAIDHKAAGIEPRPLEAEKTYVRIHNSHTIH